MGDTVVVQTSMMQERFLGMEIIEVIAVTVGEGLGVEGSPYRPVTFYMLKDGTRIGDNDPLPPTSANPELAEAEARAQRAIDAVKAGNDDSALVNLEAILEIRR